MTATGSADGDRVQLRPQADVRRLEGILAGYGDWYWADNSSYSTSKCLNFLGSLRNDNYKFELTMYSTVS
ncbi:hypothetical protein G5C60_41025 [Streptomyces sp. HC44]|uniref:Uncharacterized protein n=1 Tax=Streptomyces scabichelini TaxID=2711217 RepID=A0A6G4VIL6_9ACTN|nr:hypothetical protein [Streptomyces scabichelini]NGO13811.1 hypothetical protein [Streptomyces scabichelini]